MIVNKNLHSTTREELKNNKCPLRKQLGIHKDERKKNEMSKHCGVYDDDDS